MWGPEMSRLFRYILEVDILMFASLDSIFVSLLTLTSPDLFHPIVIGAVLEF